METPNEIFMFFVSNYSEACRQISDKINFIAPHFNTKIINIDNPETRNILLNSTTYKINSVPAVLLIHPKQNEIQLFEGIEVVNLLNKGIEMVQQLISQQQLAAQQQENETGARKGKTPLNKILSDNDEETSSRRPPGARVSMDDILEEEETDDEEEEKPPSRRKIGKTTIFPDRQFSPADDDDMISTQKYLPPKGEGHDGMARSSLSEVTDDSRDSMMNDRNMTYPPRMDIERAPQDDEEDVSPKPILKKKGPGRPPKNKVKFVDVDVEEQLNTAPTGMSMDEILSPEQGGGISKERSAKSTAIKQGAEALMAEREQIMKIEAGPSKVKRLS